jgi:ABC-type multidrug transport system ATPase subunit/uncharacterized tellurite resistance protein B-like protein
MSEKILRALMQLFAIITKQDGGVEENEERYVRNFLKQQLGETDTSEYFELFAEVAELNKSNEVDAPKLTSVLDSVKILGICKKINKTLNQSQKIVVLVRLFELVASDMKISPQRMAIITTVSDVFKIEKVEFSAIKNFVLCEEEEISQNDRILSINSNSVSKRKIFIPVEQLDKEILILRIPDVNLYFIKYTGNEDLFLNGLGLHKNNIYLFAKGSSIRLPKGKPIYYSDVRAHFLKDLSLEKISFEVKNLNYKFKNGTIGIRNINLSASQGNMIGIMGASGTGKTTLLNVLSGIEKPSDGNISINSLDLHKDKDQLRGTIGYIPQDDLLIEELTVYENLYYNAKLCFKNLSPEELRLKVEDTLLNLGLFDKKDLKVGSPFNKTISGGQRKRLNIALELIREPSILYVDEPTSGLSSRDSENVMDLLRELTLKGKLIFVVIHQPSSEIFKMFDKVIILDQGGYMVYYGNPVEAVMYFKRLDAQINSDIGECGACGNVNSEVVFNIIEAQVLDEYGNYTRQRKITPEIWEENFHREIKMEKPKQVKEKPPENLQIAGWLKQFKVYFTRDFKSKLGNTQYLLLTLLEAPVLGFILAYIIRYIADPTSETYIFRENENIPIYIFMALIVAVFLGMTVSAEEIFRDRKILKREKFLHLSHSAYLLSKISMLFLISAIQAICFVLVANSILEIKLMFFVYWFAIFTTAACANMIGLNISSAFNSAVTIYIVIPLVIIPMMVLSGAMFSFEKLNRRISRIDKVPVMAELMPTKWSYEALMVHQFKNNFFEENFYKYDKDITNADFKLSYYIPELEERLKKVDFDLRADGKINESVDDLKLLENELHSELILYPVIDSFSLELFNPLEMTGAKIDQLKSILADLNLYYLEVFKRTNKEKNNLIKNLMRNRKDTYYSYLNMYHNENVSDHVRKIYERKKIVEYNHRLVRMIDPIYMDPIPDNPLSIRTHFFAPTKHFLGKRFDTYWFNMGFIWFLSIVLYVLLYFSVLKRLVNQDFYKIFRGK